MTENMYRTQTGQVLTRTHGAERGSTWLLSCGLERQRHAIQKQAHAKYICTRRSPNKLCNTHAIHTSGFRNKQHLVAVLRHGAPRNPEQAHAEDYVQDGRRVVCCLARDEVGQHVSQRS